MYALEIENLKKTYKNGVHALKGVSFRVRQGDFFALLGPNGAGKSTIIGILCSLVKKTSGRVKILDADIDKEIERAKSYLGVVPQEFNFNPFEKVFDIVVNQAGFYGVPRRLAKITAEKNLKMLGLWEKRRGIARMLSGGMKRRLMIARALMHEPKLLILDEPTAGVDIELRRDLWRLLRKINGQGITIILTTHYLEEAENLCRHIAIIDHGQIVEHNSIAALLRQLRVQTFVLESRKPMPENVDIAGHVVRRVDGLTLEVDVQAEHNLNEVFAALSQCGIDIFGMRNKSNRLEELFLRLTGGTEGTT